MPEVQVIGARIREMRDARGLTQGQLAYKADTTVTQISRLENDERPGAQAIIVARVAAALDTTVDYLMGLTDVAAAASIPTDDLDPEIRATVERITALLLELQQLAPEMIPSVRNLFYMQLESHMAAVRAGLVGGDEEAPAPEEHEAPAVD